MKKPDKQSITVRPGLPINPCVVDGVCKIANHIYQQRGYAVRIQETEVSVVLEAAKLLSDQMEIAMSQGEGGHATG